MSEKSSAKEEKPLEPNVQVQEEGPLQVGSHAAELNQTDTFEDIRLHCKRDSSEPSHPPA